MDYKNFERSGVFTNGITVEKLIENLSKYKESYGNQPVTFVVHGEEDCFVKFEYYQNALVVYAEEEDPR